MSRYLWIEFKNEWNERDEDGILIPYLVEPSGFGIETYGQPITLESLKEYINQLTVDLYGANQLHHRLSLQKRLREEKNEVQLA